ncbi:MAG: hypothetical protein LCH95_17625 [Proteobacteria bacterium]|nr:hypothetical protein [Pseudomonadota bacterium]
MARIARRLIVAAAAGLITMAVLGIVLTHDAWPLLQKALLALVDGGLSLGTLPVIAIVAALVLFATLFVARTRRAAEDSAHASLAPAWLAVAFALFCGLMFTASWLQAQSVRGEFLAERKEQQAAIARLKAQQVDDWAYERGIDVRFLVDTLKTLPLDEIERQPEIRQLAELVLAQFLSGHAERISVTLARADGQPLVTAGTIAAAQKPALGREIRDAARLRRDLRGEILPGGARPEGLAVTFLVPFTVPARGGAIELVAAAMIDPTIGLLRSFASWPMPSRSSELELVFRDGADIVHIVPPGPTPSVPLSFRTPMATPGLIVNGLQQSSVETDATDHHGHRVVAAVQTVSAFPWIVIAKTDYAEAMGPIERQIANIWLMTGGLVVFAGLFMLALWFQLRLTAALRAARRL